MEALKANKILILLTFLLIVMSCSKDEEIETNREYITTCYKFVEEGSNLPISGLRILIHYGYSNVLSSQGITDDNGMWCFQHWNDNGNEASLYQPLLEDAYFMVPESLPLNVSIYTLEMIPKSFIRIHVVNVPPSSVFDRIDVSSEFFVTFEGKPKYGYRTTVPFEGKDIDAYYYFPAIKGLNEISWVVKNSDNIISTHIDKVIIEQYRDRVDYLIEY